MRFRFNLLVPVVAVAACLTATAQTPDYKNVGRTPTAQEVQAMDIAVGTDGKELPAAGMPRREGFCSHRNARPATAKIWKEVRRRRRSSAEPERSLPCTQR